jgi:hypothetical protein
MAFHWASIVFGALVLIFPATFIYGLFKKSWIAMLISGTALLPSALYFGVGGELRFALVFPLIPIVLAIIYYRKLNHKNNNASPQCYGFRNDYSYSTNEQDC